MLADGIAARVSPIYAMAAAGDQVSLLPAWIAAFGFTLQIYFDFSGYSAFGDVPESCRLVAISIVATSRRYQAFSDPLRRILVVPSL